jgi:hypothetical protein
MRTDGHKLTVAFRNFENAPKSTQNATQGIPACSSAVQVFATPAAYVIRTADDPSNSNCNNSRRRSHPGKRRLFASSWYVFRSTFIITAPTARIFVKPDTVKPA